MVSKSVSFCSSIKELDVVMSLQHPYVVQCYGLSDINMVFSGGRPSARSDIEARGYKDDETVQVYEYYELTLDKLIASGTLNPQEALVLVLRLLIGLEYIHGHGVAHRDLKPSNILIDELRRPRIGDFGQAQKVTAVSSNVCQTLLYRSPEVVYRWSLNDYDVRATDMWALGCIVREICSLNHRVYPNFQELPENESVLLHYMQSTFEGVKDLEEKSAGKVVKPTYIRSPLWPLITPEWSTLNQLASHLLCVDPRKRPTAESLLSSPDFFRHTYTCSKILSIRSVCPPFPTSLDILEIPDCIMVRSLYGTQIRALVKASLGAREEESPLVTFLIAFHAIEILDRLANTGEEFQSPNVVTVLYVLHKFFTEEHVREPLAFTIFCRSVGVTEADYIDLEAAGRREAHLLLLLHYIVDRITPFECYMQKGVKSEQHGSTLELYRLLNVYTRLGGGRKYHVGDVVAASEKVILSPPVSKTPKTRVLSPWTDEARARST